MEFIDETFVPSNKDAEKAKAFSRTFARGFAVNSRVTLQREGDGEAVEIPHAVVTGSCSLAAVSAPHHAAPSESVHRTAQETLCSVNQ